MEQGAGSQKNPVIGYAVQGKYRLIEKLSEGGGGVVWDAASPDGGRVALKFLKWNPMRSHEACADRFKNEFAILKSLSHPNIGRIYDFGLDQDAGLYFFTSELLVAGDLTRLLLAPVPLLEELLLQALRALEYLRGHKLLHLDIKPHNLLLRSAGENPTLALIDFGLATFRPPDRPGGTPNYMAPELISLRLGEEMSIPYPPPDHRSDLYSLGVTFYHCLTGHAPFNVTGADGRKDPMATLRRHFEIVPAPPSTLRPEIPPYLDRVVMKLMSLHPDERYPSAVVAAQALQYSSPVRRDPECLQTLLAYLPKEGKLVGRRRESSIIVQSLKDVAEGKRHAAPVICISGGRGTGRSRMLGFAKPIAQQMEMDTHLIEEGAELGPSIFDDNRPGGADPVQARAILIDDIERFMTDSQECPREENGARALMRLIRRLRLQQRLPDAQGARSVLVFTINSDRMNVESAFSELNLDHSLCHLIRLDNFSEEEVGEYLDALLGEKPDNTVVSQLTRCTGGNPLFLTEHLEQMISQGRLFSLAGRPDAATLKTIGVDFSKAPPSRSLADSIKASLKSLAPKIRQAAVALACWQRPASVEELAAASARGSMERELLALMEAGLIRARADDGRMEFTNAMAGRVICEAAQEEEIRACHDRIAGFLISGYIGARAGDRTEIDLHLAYGSGSPERIPALKRLAERAIKEAEPLDAAAHLDFLLRVLPDEEIEQRASALANLGTAYERAHRIADARSAYTAIKNLKAPPPLRDRLRVEAAEKLGLLAMRRRELKEARRCFSEAIAFLGDAGDPASRLTFENYLAGVELRDGRIESAVKRFEKNASEAGCLLSPDQQRRISNNELGEALLAAGRARDAEAILKEELALAKDAGDAQRTASKRYLLGNAARHDQINDMEAARNHYEEGLALAKKHRLIELQVRLLNGLGNLMLKIKRPSEALARYHEGLKLAQQMEGETTGVEIMIGMGLAAQQMSAPDNTIEYFEAALDFSSAPKSSAAGLIRRYRPTIYISLGDAYFQKHDLDHAEEYLRKALKLDKKSPLTPDIRYSLYGTFVELALERGDMRSAMRYMPMIEAIAGQFPQAREHLSRLKRRVRT